MHKAFLQSIVETPDDDTPRLIYADWLDDQGDADRAEFIRLQCSLGNQPVPNTEETLRAEDLLDAHEHTWVEEFPESAEFRAASFERGFVSRVDVDTLEAFRRHAAVLRQTPAHKVRVKQQEGSLPADWPEWDECWGVAGLDFKFWPFGPEQTAILAASAHLAGLRSLAITYSDFDSNSLAILAGSPHLAGLTHLDLTNHLVSAEGVRALARSPTLCNLRTLDLGHDVLTDSDHNRFDVEAVVELSRAANLRNLVCLRVCPYELTAEACAALAGSSHLTGIRSLGLACGDRSHVDIAPLLGSPLLTGLERLELDEVFLTDEDVVALLNSPAPARLRSLALGVEGCGGANVEALLRSSWGTGLQELKLVDAPGQKRFWSASPVEALTAAESLAGLRELNLSSVHVSDEGLAMLAGCRHLSRVASLKLGYTDSLTLTGVRALAEGPALPALRRLYFRGACLGEAVVKALSGTPLASRLTALNLRGQRLGPGDVVPFLDRGRWPCLVRLELAENLLDDKVCDALRECWGPVVRLEDEWRQYDWYD
jgi:uncharacterized protein (TIGR02996 family)